MREIMIKRINTASAVKPILLIATAIGAIVGCLMSLIWLIGPKTESAEGIVVNSVKAPYMNLYWNVGNTIIESIVYCIGIAIVILMCMVLFNFFLQIVRWNKD